jgi:hypothetical protein
MQPQIKPSFRCTNRKLTVLVNTNLSRISKIHSIERKSIARVSPWSSTSMGTSQWTSYSKLLTKPYKLLWEIVINKVNIVKCLFILTLLYLPLKTPTVKHPTNKIYFRFPTPMRLWILMVIACQIYS